MLRARLRRRLNQLREARQRLAKRSRTVYKRKRQQRRARRQLKRAVKRKAPEKEINALQGKLAEAHELLDKAMLGKEGMEKRERRLEKKVAHLKDKIPDPAPTGSGVSTPNTSWNPNQKQIANWMIPWIQKSYNAGWRGTITSGYRSPAYSTGLCMSMCGAPSCSGTCAGASSNHSGSSYPRGAVDLTDYYDFKAIQYRIGSPLRNYLGSRDPVHFSYSGA